jgi:glycosyltransferase involved in cell wall biosynthesis
VRLAWFTPWPPQTSGIAGRSVEVTRVLADRGWAIDVFVDRPLVPSARPAADAEARAGEVRVQSAHDFLWRRHRQQHDLVVYQLGNSTAHNFIWPYLLRYPGLVVLHDAHLHHSRGAALITPGSAQGYRAAFAADHPDVAGEVSELAVAGFDGSYYFLWPMVRSAVLAARAVGVHARGAVRTLQPVHPGVLVDYLALGMGRDRLPGADEQQQARRTLGITGDALVFGVFGGLTADKRVPQVLKAFARLRRLTPRAHLLLAGTPDPRLGLPRLIEEAGLSAHVSLASGLDDDQFERALSAVDVSLNLRWPTARETSGPWLTHRRGRAGPAQRRANQSPSPSTSSTKHTRSISR